LHQNPLHHIPVQSLPEKDRFTRLRTERKHFVDTIKMIACRAETSLASLLREHLIRSDDARALLRHIFHNDVDLLPDSKTNTLTVDSHLSVRRRCRQSDCERLTGLRKEPDGSGSRLSRGSTEQNELCRVTTTNQYLREDLFCP